MAKILQRIDSCDEADLDPWEMPLNTLRQMVMLECFGTYRTSGLWTTSAASGDPSRLFETLKQELFAKAKAAAFEYAHTKPTSDDDTLLPSPDFESAYRA